MNPRRAAADGARVYDRGRYFIVVFPWEVVSGLSANPTRRFLAGNLSAKNSKCRSRLPQPQLPPLPAALTTQVTHPIPPNKFPPQPQLSLFHVSKSHTQTPPRPHKRGPQRRRFVRPRAAQAVAGRASRVAAPDAGAAEFDDRLCREELEWKRRVEKD